VIDPALQELVQTIFAAPQMVVEDETTPSEIPNWDSLKLVNLVFAIEERFHVQLDNDELMQVANFGELQELISRGTSEG
jgi:acyl carrier protein